VYKVASFALIALVISTTSWADELPLGMLAIKIPEAAVAAVKFRDSGKPQEFLTSALPSKGSPMTRVGQEMHRIADEIYQFSWVQNLPYFVYTQRRLKLELNEKAFPTNFSQVSEAVRKCQTEIPESEEQKLIQCVTSAVDNFAKAPN
jgi:hypothetical protein